MPEPLINLVLAELAHIGAGPLRQVEEYLRSGADPSMAFVERSFVLTPSGMEKRSRQPSLNDYRPVYGFGAFPQQRAAAGPGNALLNLQRIVRKVAERQSLRDQYGEAAIMASPKLAEPVI